MGGGVHAVAMGWALGELLCEFGDNRFQQGVLGLWDAFGG